MPCDTWVTVRYVSRYMGHGTIRIAIHGSRYDTYRDTCSNLHTIRIVIESRYDKYRDTCLNLYFSRDIIIIIAISAP